MKKIIAFFILINSLGQLHAQSVGIGTTTPDASAALEINSTNNKGFLPPRISINDLGNIINPARGLIVYVTDRQAYYYWESGQWQRVVTENEIQNYWFLNGTVVYNNINRIGIGTNAPNANAVLDISSVNKGILFPRLTMAQRLAIANPPNGLHLFNTDIGSLEFYDSLRHEWAPYSNKILNIHIDSTTVLTNNGYNLQYSSGMQDYINITIDSYVILEHLDMFDNLTGAPPNLTKIFVTNYGQITGSGGAGGIGAYRTTNPDTCSSTSILGKKGNDGQSAITIGGNTILKIFNFGIIAGGGGGGGGGASASTQNSAGGGGGGGQGYSVGGGSKGQLFTYDPSPPFPPNTNCHLVNAGTAQNGTEGTRSAAGTGGNGSTGTPAGQRGGNGGNFAQNGAIGSGITYPGAGGLAGKAVKNYPNGSHSNSIINFGAGIVYGVID